MADLTADQRIAYARELLSNPFLRELLDAMLTQALKEWDGTTEDDVEARERAWRKRQTVTEFNNRLREVLLKEKGS